MKPLHHFVIIKLEEVQSQTESGILLSASAQGSFIKAKVVAVGPEVKHIEDGAIVLVGRGRGHQIPGTNNLLVENTDIFVSL